jgi:hypothetical protein
LADLTSSAALLLKYCPFELRDKTHEVADAGLD